MKKILVFTIPLAILSLCLFPGCSQSSTPEATLTPPQATPAPSPETPPTDFYLEVTQPADNSIIDVGTVEVMGHISPEAVVSVNDEIAIADTEGTFAVTITLEEGPNIIEVIASDDEGNEARASLTVTLVKGE